MGQITIDRTAPFDPVKVKFLGQGWVIDEQDERALSLNQVDLASVRLEHMLKKGEDWIGGEEKLKRLKKAGYVRLDAKVFQTLWENQALIPELWKERTSGHTATLISFDGTILRRQSGYRYVLYLYWGVDRWLWLYSSLASAWTISYPSAVLASI